MFFRKWEQYWLSYAAQINHASNQNYSNLSVLTTVFQALKPLPHITCCSLHYLYLKSIFMQLLILSARHFRLLSSICSFDCTIRTELPCLGGRLGRLWVPVSERSVSGLIIDHHFISYLEKVSLFGYLVWGFYNGNNSKAFILYFCQL